MLTPRAPALELVFPSVQAFHMLGQVVELSLLPHPASSTPLILYRNLEGELVLCGIWGIMQINKDISGDIMFSCCMEDNKS